jgi:GT2 family glycosyltransferase
MLVRREAMDDVGLLSERYFMYAEDVDWCWRFRQRGWKTMFTPEAWITHFGQASSSQCAADMLVRERQSLLLFLETKSGKTTRWVANAMFCAASTARMPLLALKWLTGGPASEQARQQWPLAAATLRFHLFGRVPRSN